MTAFSARIAVGGKESQAAPALIKFLSSPTTDAITKSGMEPVTAGSVQSVANRSSNPRQCI
jgi:hypothetical protein